MKRPGLVLVTLSLTVLCLAAAATARSAETGPAAPGLKNPFFALCHDTHDAKKRTLAEQAEMLKTLGYDGAAHLWLDAVPERLKTLDAQGLKLCQIYVRVSIDPKQPKFDPRFGEVCKLLKGRDVKFGLLVGGGKPSDPAGDERAVAILREIGDLAAGSNLRVAMYPHVGDWVEKTSDAVRVARKVDRKNVGVMFNLCHWLKADDPARLQETLREAMPYLFVVTINGADAPPGNWDRLIQPLGRGSYDVGRVLRLLHQTGYRGPIGLQCYGIPGDAAVHLKQSIEAWKKLSAEAGREK
jgi:sugar phosphate isomerase/epimerase